ncbi:hypothetical protein CPC08DRAFT_103288 [Agrocybe pediades]|nr:hypothetical protein CPC08DRAFT_103288 [Agrocybe pediades]
MRLAGGEYQKSGIDKSQISTADYLDRITRFYCSQLSENHPAIIPDIQAILPSGKIFHETFYPKLLNSVAYSLEERRLTGYPTSLATHRMPIVLSKRRPPTTFQTFSGTPRVGGNQNHERQSGRKLQNGSIDVQFSIRMVAVCFRRQRFPAGRQTTAVKYLHGATSNAMSRHFGAQTWERCSKSKSHGPKIPRASHG